MFCCSQSKIEQIVRAGCDHLPGAVKGQCREFVDTYGNAFIALLAQEIDPSQVMLTVKLAIMFF